MAGSIAEIKVVGDKIRENVARVIVGKSDVVDLAVVALLSEGHILFEDVPGIGKTTLAKSLARSLGCTFHRIQFTPDLLPSDVTGLAVYNQKTQEFEFRPGPIMAQVVLADEINRATPRTQSALLEAMQERQITVDGATKLLPRPFMVLATQTQSSLKERFRCRGTSGSFFIRLKLGYPTEDEEGTILLRYEQDEPLETLQAVLNPEALVEMGRVVRTVQVEASLREYIIAIVRATRAHSSVELGASPRGSLFLYRAAQALAALRGRDFVLPDDIKYLAPFVLTHRLIISAQTRLRGRSAEQVVKDVVDSVPVPVESA
jgi:MoxR-like ATPase